MWVVEGSVCGGVRAAGEHTRVSLGDGRCHTRGHPGARDGGRPDPARAHVCVTARAAWEGWALEDPCKGSPGRASSPHCPEAPVRPHLYERPGPEWGLCGGEAPPAQPRVRGCWSLRGRRARGGAGPGVPRAAPTGRPPPGRLASGSQLQEQLGHSDAQPGAAAPPRE